MFISNVYYLSYLPWSMVTYIHHSDRLLAPQVFHGFPCLWAPWVQPVEQVRYTPHPAAWAWAHALTEPDGRAADGGMWGKPFGCSQFFCEYEDDWHGKMFIHTPMQSIVRKEWWYVAAIVYRILPCKGLVNIKKIGHESETVAVLMAGQDASMKHALHVIST